MNEFLLLCEHLDTCPKRNSNPKGNFNPNKMAGDVPLAPSAKNISLVSPDMPKPESKDKGQSRAESKDASSSKEEKSTTSSNDENIISGKLDSNTNKVVPSGTKVFSSFQVGKQHPKEEEYLAFTRQIYNLPGESGETVRVLGTTSLFPRISIFLNGSPNFTAQLFEFGYLDQGFWIAIVGEETMASVSIGITSLIGVYVWKSDTSSTPSVMSSMCIELLCACVGPIISLSKKASIPTSRSLRTPL
ncbi:hypothetical protein H5410_056146 [Solanum commersonii]|uniref:Uncharacterized protein n=1 Tax=Solanum commersonii TaxID=4109 RepID=A0A9J5WLF1_SOLCO|nr:hypothetical protein H5410_056146 [Solanum commersonii]